MAEYQTYQANWQGIPLSVSYCPEKWGSYREIYGYALAHLTITADRPLPITETGYLSHHTCPELIEAEGGPVVFVLAWLDFEGELPEWKARQAAAAQLCLF